MSIRFLICIQMNIRNKKINFNGTQMRNNFKKLIKNEAI